MHVLVVRGIWITLCVIRSISDVELPMRFELAHSVPKLFKFLHFVTSLLIAYDGPRGRVIFSLSMLRARAVLNCLIWWVIVND